MLAEAFSILRCSVFIENIHFSPASLLSLSVWWSFLVRYHGDTAKEKKLHMCACARAGYLGAAAEERRIWSAERLFRRQSTALDGRLGPGQTRPECCLCFSATADSPQQQLQGTVSRKMRDDTESNVIDATSLLLWQKSGLLSSPNVSQTSKCFIVGVELKNVLYHP